jgi:hypothetical protein
MTHDLEELRTVIRDACREQVNRAAVAVMAVPAVPKWTYRRRLMSALTEAAPSLTEKDFFQAWRDDPNLSRVVTILHTTLCNTPLSRVSIRYDDEAHDNKTI